MIGLSAFITTMIIATILLPLLMWWFDGRPASAAGICGGLLGFLAINIGWLLPAPTSMLQKFAGLVGLIAIACYIVGLVLEQASAHYSATGLGLTAIAMCFLGNAEVTLSVWWLVFFGVLFIALGGCVVYAIVDFDRTHRNNQDTTDDNLPAGHS